MSNESLVEYESMRLIRDSGATLVGHQGDTLNYFQQAKSSLVSCSSIMNAHWKEES
jgi:hypothetical protein